jgi:catalase
MSSFGDNKHPFNRRQAVLAGAAAGVTALAGPASLCVVSAAAAAPIDQAAVDDTPADLVDALHSAFGKRHVRAVHAKGVVLTGVFVPDAEAKTLCKAGLFNRPSTQIVARFSDFTGIPDIPDTVGDANPRGLALKFRLQGSDDMDIVAHSFDGFPTKTSEEFGALLRAIGSSGPGTASPTPLETFFKSHPIARTFLTTQKPAPESYATVPFFGVNAFAFISATGVRSHVRYRFVPRAGEHYLDTAAIATRGPNYLADEIAMRIGKSPVSFDWFAQVAQPGDAIDDPSIAWPQTRQLVRLGVITIDTFGAEQPKLSSELLFLPGNIPTGIEIADPMLAIRTEAYPISFAERQ